MKETLQYDEQTARIAAMWQLGLRDNVRIATVGFAVFMIALEVTRYLAAGTPPASSVLRTDAAAAAVFLFAAFMLDRKTKQKAKEIMARPLTVDFLKDAVVIAENGSPVFSARNDAITGADAGALAVRFRTEYDAACVPRKQVPEALLEELRGRLGRQYREHGWM